MSIYQMAKHEARRREFFQQVEDQVPCPRCRAEVKQMCRIPLLGLSRNPHYPRLQLFHSGQRA